MTSSTREDQPGAVLLGNNLDGGGARLLWSANQLGEMKRINPAVMLRPAPMLCPDMEAPRWSFWPESWRLEGCPESVELDGCPDALNLWY
ncbi:hypothetical protein Dimus_018083 [Dionaea muscipula]